MGLRTDVAEVLAEAHAERLLRKVRAAEVARRAENGRLALWLVEYDAHREAFGTVQKTWGTTVNLRAVRPNKSPRAP